MPTFSARGKNGNSFRKDSNDRMVGEVLKGDLEDATYGRVLKHLGNGRILVLLPNNTERQAVIRGVLRRRRVTPIQSGDIVVLGERSFVVGSSNEVYDVMAVMTRRDASRLVRDRRLPDWMLDEGGAGTNAVDDLFDHEDAAALAEGQDDDDNNNDDNDDADAVEGAAAAVGGGPAPAAAAAPGRRGGRTGRGGAEGRIVAGSADRDIDIDKI